MSFIRLPDVAIAKKKCWNYCLVQDLIPAGKSKIREAWEEELRSPKTITEIFVAVYRDYSVTRRNVNWFACSRNSENKISIGGWGTEKQVIDGSDNLAVRAKILSAIKYLVPEIIVEGSRLRSPNQCEIFFTQNDVRSNHAFDVGISGLSTINWKELSDRNQYWSCIPLDRISFASEEMQHEFPYLIRGTTPPVKTAWRSQPIRQYPIDPFLAECLDKAGAFFRSKPISQIEIPARVTKKVVDETNQPDYSDLPKLRFIFVLERSFDDTTTITRIKSDDGELSVEEEEFFDAAKKSEYLHVFLKSIFDSLIEEYSEILNLSGNDGAIAQYFGEKILVISNDFDLDFDAGFLGDARLEEIEIERVDIGDKNTHNLENIKQKIRSFLVDEKLVFSVLQKKELQPEFFEEKSFKNYSRTARALIYYFATLHY